MKMLVGIDNPPLAQVGMPNDTLMQELVAAQWRLKCARYTISKLLLVIEFVGSTESTKLLVEMLVTALFTKEN